MLVGKKILPYYYENKFSLKKINRNKYYYRNTFLIKKNLINKIFFENN